MDRALLEAVAELVVREEVLDAAARRKLPRSAFVFPEKAPGSGAYPIHDRAHAVAALSYSSGKPEEAAVRAAVRARYPGLGKLKEAWSEAARAKALEARKAKLHGHFKDLNAASAGWAHTPHIAVGGGVHAQKDNRGNWNFTKGRGISAPFLGSASQYDAHEKAADLGATGVTPSSWERLQTARSRKGMSRIEAKHIGKS